MSQHEDLTQQSDESFGPGTDLVVSLFAVLLLVLVQVIRVQPLESPKPPNEATQILVILEESDEQPLFEKDHAALTPHAEQQLRRALPDFRSALESESWNQLLIEGHASPEAPATLSTRERERWNLTLSIERSMAVIDFLYSLDVPYECMRLAGFGRSHSKILRTWLREAPSRSVFEWDLRAEELAAETDERALGSERLVKIFGVQHSSSICQLSAERSLAAGPRVSSAEGIE